MDIPPSFFDELDFGEIGDGKKCLDNELVKETTSMVIASCFIAELRSIGDELVTED